MIFNAEGPTASSFCWRPGARGGIGSWAVPSHPFDFCAVSAPGRGLVGAMIIACCFFNVCNLHFVRDGDLYKAHLLSRVYVFREKSPQSTEHLSILVKDKSVTQSVKVV